MSSLPAVGGSEDASPHARAADRWIARRLREIDYDLSHPDTQLVADHLRSAGVGTLVNLKRSNELLNACEKLIRCALPEPPESWDREWQHLIVRAVTLATPDFMTRGMRKWDPWGPPINTCFVDHCLFEFKEVYQEYCADKLQWRAENPPESEGGDEKSAISQEFVAVATLTAKGLNRKQIAAELGISVNSLDRRITEYHQKLHGG